MMMMMMMMINSCSSGSGGGGGSSGGSSSSSSSSSSSIRYQQIPIPILFADNTSVLSTSPNNIQFQSDLNIVFGQLNKWFRANLLSLNFHKTYFILFTNKSTFDSDI